MATMDLLEQDNYYDTTQQRLLRFVPLLENIMKILYLLLFLDEVASSKLNLHGGFFRKNGHLGLFEAKHTCVIYGFARYYTSFVSGLSAWIVVFGVEHEEYLVAVDLTSYVGTIPTWLASYFLV